MIEPDWADYKNFSRSELACKHCGRAEMDSDFMSKLQNLREVYGKSMMITSGFRCKEHPIEARKENPGAHTTGHAVDIAVRGSDAHKLLGLAIEHGFTGIGVQQKGDGRFIHLDDIIDDERFPRPWVWSY